MIDIFSELAFPFRQHIAEFQLGGVGNSVEAYQWSIDSLAGIGPDTRSIGQLTSPFEKPDIRPPRQSRFDANAIIPFEQLNNQADDGQVHELAWDPPEWHHRVVTRDAGGPTAAAGTALTATTLEGNPRVYYQADDRQVHELAWDPPEWHHRVVTRDAGGPTAAAGTALTATTLEGNPRVYYQADDRQVHELAWDPPEWHHRVVTRDAGGPTAAAGTALTATTLEGNPRVYYQADDRQVHELAWDPPEWHHRVVTRDAGGPTAAAGTALTATTLEGNPRVYYQADDRQVHELAWDPPEWHHRVVTRDAGGPTAAAGTALTATTLEGNPRVYYQADDRQVHELAWDPPEWHHRVVTRDAGGPTAAAGTALTATTLEGNPRVYYQWLDDRRAPDDRRARVVALNANCDVYDTLTNEVVLRQADWYRLLVPHQSLNFDSTLPFFYLDSKRQYLVIPSIYYQNGNYFTANVPAYVYHPNYRAEYQFVPFYHAFVPLFIRELNRGGIDALFDRELQLDPNKVQGTPAFDFGSYYGPTEVVLGPYPTEDVDFDDEAGYAIYNWELFFHTPLLIANSLSRNQKFEDARHWYQYIFDPTSTTAGSSPQCYWVTKPFFQMQAPDYLAQRIEMLMQAIAKHDPVAEHRVMEWRNDAFDPHMIARFRPVAYQRAVVMRYIDNLIAQGDQLFMQYTTESVNEARQYFIMASDLLGPKPQEVPPKPRPVMTYQELEMKGLDKFANAIVAAENALPPVRVNVPTDPRAAKLPMLLPEYFCVPPNQQLLAYWDKVADRLFKIRHCMNIEGVLQPLALFAPRIDPGLLVRAMAAGLDLGSALSDLSAAAPPYRFVVMVRQAASLCDEVRALGGELLSAMEKRDAEKLALIRSGASGSSRMPSAHCERGKSTRLAQIDVLGKNKLAVQERYDFYENVDFINAAEAAALAAKGLSLISDTVAICLESSSAVAHALPSIQFGISGFGGTPHATLVFGGDNVGTAASSAGQAIRIASAILHTAADMATIIGSYQRRKDDWDLQFRIADRELARIESETTAASIRKEIAQMELDNHAISIREAAEVDDFLHQKFTNQDLYDWMVGQISTVYFQAYQLAYGVAKQAEQCFRHELGVDDSSYITFGYWDSLKKGLLAADRLTYDLKRMESAYYAQFTRELELTRHVSLAAFDPFALVELKKTGHCNITLPELFFDLDNPGHYMRRVKTVAVTVPCVVGPYSSVSLTLTLLDNHVRTKTDTRPVYERKLGDDDRFRDDIGGSQAVVTSSGQNDSGLFELNFRDDRYLPFEGRGVIATWKLRLNPVFPQFDYSTITDVVLHLRFTARDGGSTFAIAATDDVKAKLNQIALAESRSGLYRLFSARHDYPTEWARFLDPGQGADQVLTIATSPDRFPFFTNGMDIKVSGIDVISGLSYSDPYDLEITPPGGTALSKTLSVDSELGGVHRWSAYPLTPKAEIGHTPAVKPYPTWTFKLKRATVADFRSLTPGEIDDLLLILRYEVS